MTRLQDILTSPHQPIYEEIIPAPDFEITFVSQSKHTVIVQCPERRELWEVIKHVKSQRSGDWMAGFWNGEGANPYQNRDGLWCYLLEQA